MGNIDKLVRLMDANNNVVKALQELKNVMVEEGVYSCNSEDATIQDIDVLIEGVSGLSFSLTEDDFENGVSNYIREINGENVVCTQYADGVVTVEGYNCKECGTPLRLMEVLDGYDTCECCDN